MPTKMKILSSVLYEMYLHSYWKVARMCAKLKLPKNVNKNNKNSKIVVSARARLDVSKNGYGSKKFLHGKR